MSDKSVSKNQSDRQNPAVSRVAIVTDSIAQVPAELAKQLGISIVPFSMALEDRIYTDLIDLDLRNLYQRMRHEKNLRFETSAPNVGQFKEIFTECLNQGAGNILYIGVSGRLSRAVSSAEEAARILREEAVQVSITIFDSRLATAAQGFLAIEAAHLAREGASPEMIVKHLDEEQKRTSFAAGFETLEFLARGGRIGKAAYMLSSAIHIHPIVSFDENGEVIPVSRKTGYNHMLEEIIHYVGEKVAGYRRLWLVVMQADALEQAEMLQRMAIEKFHPDEIYITDFTPTMVAHAGPGLIGLAYHWKP